MDISVFVDGSASPAMRLYLPVCLARSSILQANRYRHTSPSTFQPLLAGVTGSCANIAMITMVIASTKNSFSSDFVKTLSL
jgi:hypothetical protein